MNSLPKLLLTGLLLLSLATPASAEGILEGQPYLGISGFMAGARNSQIDDATGSPDARFIQGAEVVSNVGYGVALNLGWLLDSNWRTELELSRREVNLDNLTGSGGQAQLDGNLTVNSFFINIARDFRGQSWVTPYLGIGAGAGYHELDLESVDSGPGLTHKRTPITMAFQGMFGIELEVGDDTDIVVGYRYVNFWAPDYTEFSYEFVDFHNFELGLRFYPEDW